MKNLTKLFYLLMVLTPGFEKDTDFRKILEVKVYNPPSTKSKCNEVGGTWIIGNSEIQDSCLVSTHDSSKKCNGSSECESLCVQVKPSNNLCYRYRSSTECLRVVVNSQAAFEVCAWNSLLREKGSGVLMEQMSIWPLTDQKAETNQN